MNVKQTISRKYNDLSLRWKLTISFTIVLALLIIGIGTLSYNISVSNLEESEKVLLLSNLNLKGRMYSTYFESIQRKTDLLFNNQLLQTALQEDYSDYNMGELVLMLDNLYKIINPIYDDILSLDDTEQNRDGSSIKIRLYPFNESFPIDGGFIHSFTAIKDHPLVEQMEQVPGQTFWNSSYMEKGVRYITVSRIMRDFSTFKSLGVLSILIPEQNITESLKQTPNDKSEFILKSDSRIFFNYDSEDDLDENSLSTFLSASNDTSHTMKQAQIDNMKILYNSMKLEINDWQLYLLYPYKEITRKMQPIQITTMIFLFLGLFLSEILIWLISKKLSQRLEIMTSKFVQITQDRHSPVPLISGNDEIGKLDKKFNKMVEELNALIEKENGWEIEKNSLTFELLQAQINPHLLYNTLATIEWKAKKGETSGIQEITRKLIFFFKYYLNNGSLITPVAEELKMIKEFIEIFIFTYRLDCEVQFSIDINLDEYYSIKLFLQPIIENALQHGIRPVNSERKGILHIKAEKEGDDLLFEIQDNGLGMEKEKIDLFENSDQKQKSGFGMTNVKRRLVLYFGDKYGISVKSEEGRGTTVSIRIPALFENELLGIINKG